MAQQTNFVVVEIREIFPATSQICQLLFAALLSSVVCVCECAGTLCYVGGIVGSQIGSHHQLPALCNRSIRAHLTFQQISCALIFDAGLQLLNWVSSIFCEEVRRA